MSDEPRPYPPEAQDFFDRVDYRQREEAVVLETNTADLSLYTQDPRQLALELAVRSFQPVSTQSSSIVIGDHASGVIHRADRYLAWLEG